MKRVDQASNAEFQMEASLDMPAIKETDLTDFVAESKGKAANKAPDLSLMTDTEIDPTVKTAVEFQEESEESRGHIEALTEGGRTSTIGTSIRVGMESGSFLTGINQMLPSIGADYELDADDKRAFLEADMPMSSLDALMRNTKTKEDFNSKLGIIKYNVEEQRIAEKDSFTVSIMGGIGDAIGDPLSYVPLAGAASKGIKAAGMTSKLINNKLAPKLVEAGATAYLSEKYLRNQVTGKEADVNSAVIGALAFTGILHGAGKGINSAMQKRVEAVETARNTKGEDPTVQPNHDGSVRFIDDGEGGQIEITESGKLMTKGIVPPKASSSGRFWYQDLATKAASADSPEIREMAALFSRPTQGYKEGGFAAEMPTADQIKRSMDSRTGDLMADLQDVLDELTNKGSLLHGAPMSRTDFSKRIGHYIQGYLDEAELTASELAAAKRIRQHLQEYADYMADPSRLSGRSTGPLHESFIDGGSYLPRTYKRSVLNKLRTQHGDDAMIDAVVSSWRKAYESDVKGRDGIDKTILRDYEGQSSVTPEMLEDYMRRKAFGIVKGGDDVVYNTDLHADVDSLTGGRQPDYLKSRVPFSTMGEAVLPDGTPFRVDDLIDYNLESTLGGYFRNVAGQVSTMAATGKTVDDALAAINKLPENTKADRAAKIAMVEQLKVLTGKARTDYGMFDLLSDTLRDTTFAVTNGIMWIGNMAEIGSNMLSNPKMTKAALKNLTKALGYDIAHIGRMKPAELKQSFADVVAGRKLTQKMNLSYSDWAEGLAARMGTKPEGAGFHLAAGLRYASMKSAEKSPFTHLLNRTQEAIVNAGNEVGMGELIAHANGRAKSSLVGPKFLESNGIPQDVADRAIAYLRDVESSKYDRSGERIVDTEVTDMSRDAWLSDPRSADVERLLQAFNDELIMKTDGVGQQFYTPAGPMGRLVMQFKRFATASTQYAVKTFKDITQLQRVDRMLFVLGGFLSAGMYHLLTTWYKAAFMEDKERNEYLNENLAPSNIMAAAVKRTPLVAGWGLAYDTIGTTANALAGTTVAPYAGYAKSTADDAFTKTNMKAVTSAGVGNAMMNTAKGMVPSVRVLENVGSGVVNTAKLGWDGLMDDNTLRASEEARAQRQIAKNFGSFVPNDPATKWMYAKFMEGFGIEDVRKK